MNANYFSHIPQHDDDDKEEEKDEDIHQEALRILSEIRRKNDRVESNIEIQYDDDEDDNDELFNDDWIGPQNIDEWKNLAKKHCLSRYFDDFTEMFADCIENNEQHFSRERLQDFERSIITQKAKLKHPKFVAFVRESTHLSHYQSVFISNNNNNNNSTKNNNKQKLSMQDLYRVQKVKNQAINSESSSQFEQDLRDKDSFVPRGKWYVIYGRYCMEYCEPNQFLLDEALSYFNASKGKQKRYFERKFTIYAFKMNKNQVAIGQWPPQNKRLFENYKNRDLIGRTVRIQFDKQNIKYDFKDKEKMPKIVTFFGYQFDEFDMYKRPIVYTQLKNGNNGVYIVYQKMAYSVVEPFEDEPTSSPPPIQRPAMQPGMN